MNNKNKHLPRFFACLAALALWLASGAVSAQSAQEAGKRPIYLDIRPVGSAQHSSLSESMIEAMAREKLSSLGRSTIVMGDQGLPPDAYVLRILYIVHRQSRSGTVALAATASIQVLRTEDNDHDGVVQTLSIYSGLQQILVQASDEDSASARVRDAFKRQLEARISAAFQNL